MGLGENIKKARIAAGLTQKELAGDKITRNMLSQIENEKATPSVGTLKYICDRLGLPRGYFFVDNENSEEMKRYRRSVYLPEIRAEYLAENYEACYNLCLDNDRGGDDELLMMLADSAFKLGKEAYEDGRLDTAPEYLLTAVSACERCTFDTSFIRLGASAYLGYIGDVGYLHGVGESKDLYEESDLLQTMFYHSVRRLLESGDTDTVRAIMRSGFLTKKEYVFHIKANLAIAAGDYLTAIGHLLAILEESDIENMDSILLFRIYSNLELCYKELEDYQNAFVYSGHKNSLLGKIKLPGRKPGSEQDVDGL